MKNLFFRYILVVMEKRILIIDDDKEIQEVLSLFLKLEKYVVTTASTGLQGLEKLRSGTFDLIILDLNLPDVGGEQLCKVIRDESSTPIVILSAKDSVSDKVICLEYGADDYITKPFENIELLARVKAVMRRSDVQDTATAVAEDSPTTITFHSVVIDMGTRTASVCGQPAKLTPKEFELLVYFTKNRGQTLQREKIIEDLWGKNTLYRWSRSLDVHIQNLRQKIETNPKHPDLIQTVSGVGYRIKQ